MNNQQSGPLLPSQGSRVWPGMTRTHTVPPIVVTANGDLGFRRNNQMGSLCREAQEGFLEEVAHELRVSGWGGMFGT